jgi:hypothetical protein
VLSATRHQCAKKLWLEIYHPDLAPGDELKMIENRLNNRPRKRLEFITPAEVFHQSLTRVALHSCIQLF